MFPGLGPRRKFVLHATNTQGLGTRCKFIMHATNTQGLGTMRKFILQVTNMQGLGVPRLQGFLSLSGGQEMGTSILRTILRVREASGNLDITASSECCLVTIATIVICVTIATLWQSQQPTTSIVGVHQTCNVRSFHFVLRVFLDRRGECLWSSSNSISC